MDLTKLKETIDERKSQKNIENGNNGAAKDMFLNELQTALYSGKSTKSVDVIKLVENKTAQKQGEQPKFKNINENIVNNNQNINSPVQQNQVNNNDYNYNQNNDNNRELGLYEELERRSNEYKTRANSPNFNNNNNMPVSNNSNNNGMINENTINEIVHKNFGHIVEQAMRDTIIEIYTKEKILEVIEQNPSIIKKILKEIIKESREKKRVD